MRVLAYIGLVVAGAIASLVWLIIALVALGIAITIVAYVVNFLGSLGASGADRKVPAERES